MGEQFHQRGGSDTCRFGKPALCEACLCCSARSNEASAYAHSLSNEVNESIGLHVQSDCVGRHVCANIFAMSYMGIDFKRYKPFGFVLYFHVWHIGVLLHFVVLHAVVFHFAVLNLDVLHFDVLHFGVFPLPPPQESRGPFLSGSCNFWFHGGAEAEPQGPSHPCAPWLVSA